MSVRFSINVLFAFVGKSYKNKEKVCYLALHELYL